MQRKAKGAPVVDEEELTSAEKDRRKRLFNRKLKSPCLICEKPNIPRCIRKCKTLECFQQALRSVPLYQKAVNTEDNSYVIMYDSEEE